MLSALASISIGGFCAGIWAKSDAARRTSAASMWPLSIVVYTTTFGAMPGTARMSLRQCSAPRMWPLLT